MSINPLGGYQPIYQPQSNSNIDTNWQQRIEDIKKLLLTPGGDVNDALYHLKKDMEASGVSSKVINDIQNAITAYNTYNYNQGTGETDQELPECRGYLIEAENDLH